MSRVLDLTEVKELSFINEEGVYTGTVTDVKIDAGVSKKGNAYDEFTIETEEGDQTRIKVYIPQDTANLWMVKRAWRALGIDVESGSSDIMDALGNTVEFKVTKDEYEVMDDLNEPTGETKEYYNSELIF